MFPVRCYTCNSMIAQKRPRYNAMVNENVHPKDALQRLHVSRMCCRRMFLGHADLMQEQMRYGHVDIVIDAKNGTVLHRLVKKERMVSCD